MDDAIYTAASGMHAVTRQLENSAFNTVNAHTPGFQRTKVVTESFGNLVEQAGRRRELIGTREFIAFEQGTLRPSDLPFSTALEGEGFFALKGPDGGEIYTRNGDFVSDAQGRLTSRSGFEVLNAQGGSLTLDPAGGNSTIEGDGTIVQGGNEIGRIKVVEFSTKDRDRFEAISETLYEAPEDAEPSEAEETLVRHGYLETPKFDAAMGMIQMILAQKNYQSMARAMKSLDETRDRMIQSAQ